MAFGEIDSHHNFDCPSNSRWCTCKKTWGNKIIHGLLGIWLHTPREDRANTSCLQPPKETVAAIMLLYKNMKVKVGSLDEDTDYFYIVASVLQGDTLAPYLFIISFDYVLRTSIDLMKKKKKVSSWQRKEKVKQIN